MIIDIPKFIESERPYWVELEDILASIERDDSRRMKIAEIKRFHYLYQRAATDLGKLMTFSSQTGIRNYLESLVAKAYCEIHETRRHSRAFTPRKWFLKTFPRAFRARIKAFYLSVAITLAGCIFGGLAVTFDPGVKDVLIPFNELMVNPSERVKQEEKGPDERLKKTRAIATSFYIRNNTNVAITCLAFGITFGIGTIVILFYNGVILGAVFFDYILAGETIFLMGWLLPHGAVEIPAILLSGQAGLVIAGAIIGYGSSMTLRKRLAGISKDIIAIIYGVVIMLVWAGIIESFFSQYHEPVIPYSVKIGFGVVEIFLLAWLLFKSGIDKKQDQPEKQN